MLITVFVFCGCAGSGKTTLSKKIESEYNAVRLSFDEMRCLQYHDLIPNVTKALNDGENVVVDAVYGQREQRRELLKAIENTPCKKVLLYVDKPLETCLAQNAQRENPLHTFVVEGIYNHFQPPTLDEGWDEIIVIN